MSDSLQDQQYWDRHAASDPLWTVLAFPEKRGRWTVPEFMKTGEREIALLFHRFAQLGLVAPVRRALDFGCGVGRLTQALARRQERVLGADISRNMIDLARRLNQYPDRAEYMCTGDRGLDTLPARSFQFIYSNIVLQHIPPDLSTNYLGEFFRLLEPNGLLVFQLPSHRDSPADAEIKAMPDAAYRASIELATALPERVAASAAFSLMTRVRNASAYAWEQPLVGPLAVGNHWLDARGELMLTQDDGRSPLLQVVPSGLEWPVLLTVRAPSKPGTYVGEIDLVHEGISWFRDKGSPTIRFVIDVTQENDTVDEATAAMMKEYPIPEYPDGVLPTPPDAASDLSARADFPMHGVHREDVLEMISRHGASLVYLEEDRRAGPEWVSYRYFVAGRSS